METKEQLKGETLTGCLETATLQRDCAFRQEGAAYKDSRGGRAPSQKHVVSTQEKEQKLKLHQGRPKASV